MKPGAIISGSQVQNDLDLTPDVCIVGSGAGGAVLAEGLVSRGRSVVMLEEGGYHTKAEFDMQERRAFTSLYQEQGGRATGDQSIAILQGRAVGGSTVVNWASCFRTPDRILRHWESAHGVTGLTAEVLRPHFEAVEKRLNIQPWPLDQVNLNNRVLWDGAKKLGFSAGLIPRNVRGCFNSGYCGMGCPVDAKQSMHLTFLPDAVEKGLILYANCRAERVQMGGKRVEAVYGVVMDPHADRLTARRIVIRPKAAVLSGGAINTPALLLKSGINARGQVGKRTWLHPVVTMAARFEQPIEPFYGAPQSVYSHHHWERGPGKLGFFLEASPIHPMLASTALGGFGTTHRGLMARLSTVNALIALTVDGLTPQESGGTVSVRPDGRPRLDYPLTSFHFEAFREACKVMARIQFAAGALEVVSAHAEPVRMRTEADLSKLDAAPWEPLRINVFSAHLMGGSCIGKDPAKSVVDSTLRVHGAENLFVVDGSVFPTSLGVNPSETIYGIAHWAAEHIAAAAA